MEVTTIICDVCGIPKGETNHWLVAIADPDIPGIVFGPISAAMYDDTIKKEHICGRACAIKRFSLWLEFLNSTERQTA